MWAIDGGIGVLWALWNTLGLIVSRAPGMKKWGDYLTESSVRSQFSLPPFVIENGRRKKLRARKKKKKAKLQSRMCSLQCLGSVQMIVAQSNERTLFSSTHHSQAQVSQKGSYREGLMAHLWLVHSINIYRTLTRSWGSWGLAMGKSSLWEHRVQERQKRQKDKSSLDKRHTAQSSTSSLGTPGDSLCTSDRLPGMAGGAYEDVTFIEKGGKPVIKEDLGTCFQWKLFIVIPGKGKLLQYHSALPRWAWFTLPHHFQVNPLLIYILPFKRWRIHSFSYVQWRDW